jgi:GAF domain-containing protein/HAMP domain-containing protein
LKQTDVGFQETETNMLKDRYSALSKIEQRIFWITLLLSIIPAIFASTVFDTLFGASNLQYALVNAIPFSLSILSLLSAILIFFGQKESGSWILLIGALIALLLATSQAEGYGFPSAFVLLAITLFVPLQLLKGEKAAIALGVGIAGTIAIILVDTFWTLPRVPALAEDVASARVASIVVGLIILIAVAVQYRDLSIRAKLLILAVGTGLASIILVAAFATYSTQKALEQKTRDTLVSAAHHTMDQVDVFIKYSIYRSVSDAKIPSVAAYLKASPEERAASRDEMLALFNALSQSDPQNIGSYALLDKDGTDILDTYASDMGANRQYKDYFIAPMQNHVTFVSPVTYSPTLQDPKDHVFYIGTPVMDKSGQPLGVLLVRFRSALLDKILFASVGFAGQGSYGIMLDEYNIVVSHGTKPDWVAHTLVEPDSTTWDQLMLDHRLTNIPLQDLSLNLPTFDEALRGMSENDLFFSSADAAWGNPMEVGVAKSAFTKWKVAYVQPQFVALQSIVQQRRTITLTALLTGILVAIAGFLVAGTITQPISSLAATAEQIATGDLSARAHVKTGDEIHALAEAFNRMTDRLKDTLGGLERRVAERTADLDMARLLSERRAQELQSISEISRLVSSEQRLDILLTLITRLVSEKFDFYHVGIFFVDSTGQFAVLQAANSEGGQRMLARGHRLEVGHTGIVGNVAKTGEARIALDVGADAVYFDNPDLSMTRSEMALPLNVHGETLGVLDIQSTKPGVFTDTDTKTLSILADQIAIAIDNARLFGQNKQALEELQSLYNQYLRQEWKTFIHNRPNVGYVQSMISGKSLDVPIESDEIQKALDDGQVVVMKANDRSLPSMAVPVKLRGQTIGVLRIQAPTKNRTWNQDEINLAQAISDRLALALDNARLLFVSQRQTAKEQKIGEVTAKIGASINMRNVLETAVEELGRALPGSEVLIQFGNHEQPSEETSR